MCYNGKNFRRRGARMKKYPFILFDLDGTLTYSHPGIYESLRYALASLGRPDPDESRLRMCVGPPLVYSFSEVFGLSADEVPVAVRKYRERYADVGWRENEPIPGAYEALKTLKGRGYRLALATSKPEIYARRISDAFGFTSFFDALTGSGVDGSLPLKSDVIREALRRLGASEGLSLMVGDRKQDAEGARACGVAFAGLAVGYAEPGELEAEHPDYLFRGFGELLDFLG